MTPPQDRPGAGTTAPPASEESAPQRRPVGSRRRRPAESGPGALEFVLLGLVVVAIAVTVVMAILNPPG